MCVYRVVIPTSNLFLRTDSFQEEGKARKDDRPSFDTARPYWDVQMKKNTHQLLSLAVCVNTF